MPKLAQMTEPETVEPTTADAVDTCPNCRGMAQRLGVDENGQEVAISCEVCGGTGKTPEPAATAVNPDLGAEALEWKAHVKAATLDVQRLAGIFHEKSESAKAAKKRYESAVEDLQTLILTEPEPLPLFDRDKAGSNGVPDLDESELWKQEPILKLGEHGLPAGIVDKLAEAGIDSLGDLSRWQEKKKLTDVPGIGRGSADKIEEALIAYWEENPQALRPGESHLEF